MQWILLLSTSKSLLLTSVAIILTSSLIKFSDLFPSQWIRMYKALVPLRSSSSITSGLQAFSDPSVNHRKTQLGPRVSTKTWKCRSVAGLLLFKCDNSAIIRQCHVVVAVPNLIPQLNDPAIPIATGAQVGTNISHVVSGYHDTLSVS